MPSNERLGKYMEAERLPDKPRAKTHRWSMLNVRYGSVLGRVRWSPSWRQYVFDPEVAMFSADCLQEIVAFLERENEAHKGS